MTAILAIDPGPTTCGYAYVEPVGRHVRFLAAGSVASEQGKVGRLLGNLLVAHKVDGPWIVAIEQPAGFVHEAFRGPHLLATATVAGGVAWLYRDRGQRVVLLTANEARRALLGKTRLGGKARSGDTDKMIAMVLPGVVDDMPKKTNVHVRDALALAVAASWFLASERKSA